MLQSRNGKYMQICGFKALCGQEYFWDLFALSRLDFRICWLIHHQPFPRKSQAICPKDYISSLASSRRSIRDNGCPWFSFTQPILTFWRSTTEHYNYTHFTSHFSILIVKIKSHRGEALSYAKQLLVAGAHDARLAHAPLLVHLGAQLVGIEGILKPRGLLVEWRR